MNRAWFLCCFILLLFLLLCELRENSFLLSPRRAVYMQVPPWVACVGFLFFGVRTAFAGDALPSLVSVCYRCAGVWLACVSREVGWWVVPTGGAWSLGPWQEGQPTGRWGHTPGSWQQQQQGECIPREMRAMGRARLQGPLWWRPLRSGCRCCLVTGPSVVAGGVHFWSPRWLQQFAATPAA